ncbi:MULTISPECIES: DUF421 domain-containing protein [unclassified Streptococcus]|uniref:DUF421 domain-containing protein n=1 Tax=unclassified Streptococcus TaxID=2608887 RepID=UPI001071B655|nr:MULTISPECIES: DUF421 domain-containing protein [unclassified Streptococcus]MBF0787465.1 DUF421 domain-containing protein [Streptococcus sp. 19428wC2_LYSM12]MCQ9212025.1 DUF421 domain-containing protein [Streptococcus sp. B01]MCQ9213354.1 DUF421 domain-containing protein [Streptococcus sp. O1]TFV05549.1 DUF421 domain-containing protein [Streptococcus sp. LYSM12]
MTLSYLDIAIKLGMGLISLIFVINVSGKGNLSPNSASDQVQNYVLGGIIGGVIYSPSISILQYSIILLIWTMLVLSLKWLKTHHHFLKRIVDGQFTILIKNGKVDVEACRSVGLTASDVALKLRGQGIYQLKLVKRAVLEQNGQLIVVQAGEENPKYPVVADGTIQTDVLESIDRSESWLLEKLAEIGYHEVTDIFIAEYDKGELVVVTY